jgi:hypothetical protein
MTTTSRISTTALITTLFPLCLLIISNFAGCKGYLLQNNENIDVEVSRAILHSASKESYPDADVIYLLDEDIQEVFSDGSSRETAHTVIKILRDSGKHFADCKIGYDSSKETLDLVYARTINRDGEVLHLKKNATTIVTPHSDFPEYSHYKMLIFSMPGVEVGSVIDYKYVKKRKPTIEGEFNSSFIFQWYQPIQLSRYKVIAPESIDLRYRLVNTLEGHQSAPDIFLSEGKKVYLWEYREVPQILEEDNMPPLDEVALQVMVTTLTSWEEFFQWWSRKVEGKTDADGTIRKKTDDLTEGLLTESEKIEALFDFVKREVRYVSIQLGKSGYIPRTAREVFETRYGDCKDKSTLLLSMLKSAGISAHYVLIPTASTGNLINEFQYPFQFNHCIVAAEGENGYQFLDPVYENIPFDYLPEDDQDRRVLIFREHQPSFGETPLAKPKENAVVYRRDVKIMPDRSIKVDSYTRYSGEEESEFRYALANGGSTEVKESFEEAIHELFPSAKLTEYGYTDPFDFKQRLEIRLKYHAADYCKKAGDILIFQIPEPDIGIWCSEIGKEERRYAILHDSRYYQRDEVVFNIPKGYDVYHLPPEIVMKNPYFEYRSSYQKNGEKILYQAELFETAVKIPTEGYDDYRNCCQKMNKSHTRYVLFREKR